VAESISAHGGHITAADWGRPRPNSEMAMRRTHVLPIESLKELAIWVARAEPRITEPRSGYRGATARGSLSVVLPLQLSDELCDSRTDLVGAVFPNEVHSGNGEFGQVKSAADVFADSPGDCGAAGVGVDEQLRPVACF
jgi:hypothetical protein